MKKVCIEEKNREKIETLITEVEGKARVRTIGYQEIFNLCKETEKHLGIPKKHMHGVTIFGDPNAQNFPNAYSGIPQSTQFQAVYSHGKWYVTEIFRRNCKTPKNKVWIILTDVAKESIIQTKTHL